MLLKCLYAKFLFSIMFSGHNCRSKKTIYLSFGFSPKIRRKKMRVETHLPFFFYVKFKKDLFDLFACLFFRKAFDF